MISWRSGRIDRNMSLCHVCRDKSPWWDLEDELFCTTISNGLRCWGNSAEENSPDEMAQRVPGACVTDSKGLYDKMQHTVITPKGKERRVGHRMIALKKGFGGLPQPSFFLGNTVEHNWETVLTKDTETEPFASFLRNGQRWRVIFDTRFYVFKENVICWDQYTGKKPSEEDLNVEGTPLVMVLHMSTSYCTRTSTEYPEHIRHSFTCLEFNALLLQRADRIFQWT